MDFFARIWIPQLVKRLPDDIRTDLGLNSWLLVSWVFRDDNTFKAATKEASLRATGPILRWGINLPQSIIGKQPQECSLSSVANPRPQMRSRAIDKNQSQK